ncbi:LytR/AlgR family response regulator transcription factor [Taibaiella koreensis]|uniref:LytR/AlgR family response regulator transcription factor n=1 Tax=Taibaiella koreensis TaxID=1268548 RepID=UPI000E59B6D7|nr:LytTR family DNA-binding domain-containing protein [Taibaiella koreensis]
MTCIIIDDEPLAREALKMLIDDSKEVTLLASLGDPEEAEALLPALRPDIVFLDIEMPGQTGLDLAQKIASDALIIFTTAHPQYAVESYNIQALDYILKPIKPDRFHKALSKARAYLSLLSQHIADAGDFSEDHVYIKADRKFMKVQYADILYIEALRDYVVIHKADQKIITAMNLKTIYEQLPKGRFVRISRSAVVNKDHICSTDGFVITVQEQELTIGESYKQDFFKEVIHRRLLSR